MEQNTPVVNMNWVHVTQRLAREFGLPGCFVLNTEHNEWVGIQPPKTFRNYLTGLLKTKEASYFNEIRFYKYNHEGADQKVSVQFLALIPVKLQAVPYQFLGLLYESGEKLQELLRSRIMPNYTLFWLYQLVAEARVRNTNQSGQKALLKALDEQRIYAKQLESKVATLHKEIHSVKTAEMSLDQKVDEITRLLDRQMGEYDDLVSNYQNLFGDHQGLQEEYLSSCVRMESRINELESKLLLHDPDALFGHVVPEQEAEEAEADKPKSTRRLASMMERLQASTQHLVKLQNEYKHLKEGYGGVTPAQVKQLATAAEDMRKRLDYYKNRCDNQEQELKAFKAQALAQRRNK